MKELILQIQYGGLGDSLFYSHIPRIAKETETYDRVFISTRSPFRSDDIRKLVWGLNPYVDGFVDADGLKHTVNPALPHGGNLLDQVMVDCGLDDGKLHHEPEVYYQPNFIDKFHCNIYDPNYIANDGQLSNYAIARYFIANKIQVDGVMKQITPSPIDIPDRMFKGMRFSTPTLFDYCDLIYSSKSFYCLVSGSATLASALNKEAIVFVGHTVRSIFLHSNRNMYIKFPKSTKFKRFLDNIYLHTKGRIMK